MVLVGINIQRATAAVFRLDGIFLNGSCHILPAFSLATVGGGRCQLH